jgi:hypothetical protein
MIKMTRRYNFISKKVVRKALVPEGEKYAINPITVAPIMKKINGSWISREYPSTHIV